jgi:hypothetical protein
MTTAAIPGPVLGRVRGSAVPAGLTVAAEGPSVEMLVYDGGVMTVADDRGGLHRVVIDLAGLEVPPGPVPLLIGHDPERRFGVVPAGGVAVGADGVRVRGVRLSNPEADAVAADARQGFPFESSIGCDPAAQEELGRGQTAEVNGRAVAGPLTVLRTSRLREASVVTFGASAESATRIAAHQPAPPPAQTGAAVPAPTREEIAAALKAMTADELKAVMPAAAVKAADAAAAATADDKDKDKPAAVQAADYSDLARKDLSRLAAENPGQAGAITQMVLDRKPVDEIKAAVAEMCKAAAGDELKAARAEAAGLKAELAALRRVAAAGNGVAAVGTRPGVAAAAAGKTEDGVPTEDAFRADAGLCAEFHGNYAVFSAHSRGVKAGRIRVPQPSRA